MIGHRRRLWQPSQDVRLHELVMELGTNSWDKIAEVMQAEGRSAKQCRERWFYHVDPNVKRNKWAAEEDALLLKLVDEIGPRWSTIAQQLPGRTDNALKNRFLTFIRKGVARRPPSWRATGIKYDSQSLPQEKTSKSKSSTTKMSLDEDKNEEENNHHHDSDDDDESQSNDGVPHREEQNQNTMPTSLSSFSCVPPPTPSTIHQFPGLPSSRASTSPPVSSPSFLLEAPNHFHDHQDQDEHHDHDFHLLSNDIPLHRSQQEPKVTVRGLCFGEPQEAHPIMPPLLSQHIAARDGLFKYQPPANTDFNCFLTFQQQSPRPCPKLPHLATLLTEFEF
eukprot:c5919_g1_i1.p1 GENE.c5919_g1_i1~~c5919_g1_i1.p1  ORF type:complete len:335 (-),score=62.37 c5919_g1_i1:52-1056(-)